LAWRNLEKSPANAKSRVDEDSSLRQSVKAELDLAGSPGSEVQIPRDWPSVQITCEKLGLDEPGLGTGRSKIIEQSLTKRPPLHQFPSQFMRSHFSAGQFHFKPWQVILDHAFKSLRFAGGNGEFHNASFRNAAKL
jgi:hypothetical protein